MKIRCWIKRILASVLALLIAGLAVNASAATLFQDDFEDGNTTGWSFIGSHQSNWQVSGGVLKHGGGYDGNLSIALITGITTPQKFSLEADVSVKSNRFGYPDWGHVGLAWGVNQDDLSFNTTYLRTHMDHVTSWSAPWSNFTSESVLNTPGTVNGPTYHLLVDVDSSARAMTVSLNGWQTMFTGANFDLLNQNNVGGIGLISWSDNVTWDNMKLSIPTGTPVPGSAVALLIGTIFSGLGLLRRKMVTRMR